MKPAKRIALQVSFLLILCFLCVVALADFLESDWQYYHEIIAPAPGPGGFVAVAVGASVYARSRPGLEDLRVIGPDNEEMPYVIQVPRGKVRQTRYRPQIINRALKQGERRDLDTPYVIIIPRDEMGKARGDAATINQPQDKAGWQEFVVDFNRPGQKSNRLELLIPDRNFRRPVRVYGSEDAKDWRLIKDGIYIFDFTGDVHVRELTLNYPQSIFQYLKVEIGMKEDQKPLNVKGVEIKNTLIEPSVESTFNPVSISIKTNEKLKTTDISVDLGGRGIPVKNLTLEISDPEFYRKVQVLDQDFKKSKKQGNIYRYSANNFTHEFITIELGEMRLGQFGIRIHNYDNQPLEVTDIEATGVMRAVVFRPPARGRARLFSGNPNAQRPVYDLAKLYPEVKSRELPPMAKPGKAIKNPDYMRPRKPSPPRDRSWMIWLALIPAVAIMAYLLARHTGQIKDD